MPRRRAQQLRNRHTTPLATVRNTGHPPTGGGGDRVRPGDKRKEENRLLLKEWFAQKREIPDVAGMSHVGTILRRLVDEA